MRAAESIDAEAFRARSDAMRAFEATYRSPIAAPFEIVTRLIRHPMPKLMLREHEAGAVKFSCGCGRAYVFGVAREVACPCGTRHVKASG